MKVKILVVGQLATNCYLVFEEKTKKCFIVDPGDDSDYIIREIKDLGLRPQAILATHGHFDHVLGATELKLAFKIPFYLHQADLFLLKRAAATAQYFTGFKAEPVILPDDYLVEGQILKAGNLTFQVLETPGHTPGSVTFLTNDRYPKTLFVGDLLFAQGGYGRTDLEGGNEAKLKNSIKKIFALGKEAIIYPGHGQATTTAKEKKYYSNLVF